MKYFLCVCATCAIAGCVSQITPAISQFNGDSVSIQLNGNQMEFADATVRDQAKAAADAEATRICRKGSKKRAEFASTRNIPTGQYSYITELLYLCLN